MALTEKKRDPLVNEATNDAGTMLQRQREKILGEPHELSRRKLAY
jgi:hypothetical protein